MRLKGKKALVTGGSRGIGAAIVRRFLQEGADVAFTYNSSAEQAEKIVGEGSGMRGTAFAVRADAADADSLERPISQAIEKLGGIDILVNNAAAGRTGCISELDLADYDKTFAVNVRAVVETTRIAQEKMPSGGRIILIGSVMGERAISKNCSMYSASKFAVAGLGRSWAHDLGPRNITVNVIQPGPIDTDMNPASGDNAHNMIEMTALKRFGKPEEVASLAVFLASDESAFITGATINIDGGSNA